MTRSKIWYSLLVKTINITTKNNTEKEIKVANVVREIASKYNFPVSTNKVVIENGVIPHSHPVLTMNTRVDDPLELLSTLIHEQLHWFAQEHPKYDEAIEYLKEHYEDNGECNKSGTYPNSFWEHIIVCWNTRNVLQDILAKEEVEHIYDQWQPYPKTEHLILNKFDDIKGELVKFDMIAT